MYNPQSLNRYSYGLNNPVKYTESGDPGAIIWRCGASWQYRSGDFPDHWAYSGPMPNHDRDRPRENFANMFRGYVLDLNGIGVEQYRSTYRPQSEALRVVLGSIK
jgi:hypothetical protein